MLVHYFKTNESHLYKRTRFLNFVLIHFLPILIVVL